MRDVRVQRTRVRQIELEMESRFSKKIRILNTERAHCYCDAWDLTWPHYIAEHTDDHDHAAELRARRSEGLAR